MKKRNGFTLIELVVLIAISGILVSTASISIKQTLEKRALKKTKSEVSETLRSYVERSYFDGDSYKVIINANENYLKVTTLEDYTKEKLELPKQLNYLVNIDYLEVDHGDEIITVIGSDESLEFHIKDSGGTNKYMVEILNNSLSGLVNVNTYEWNGTWN